MQSTVFRHWTSNSSRRWSPRGGRRIMWALVPLQLTAWREFPGHDQGGGPGGVFLSWGDGLGGERNRGPQAVWEKDEFRVHGGVPWGIPRGEDQPATPGRNEPSGRIRDNSTHAPAGWGIALLPCQTGKSWGSWASGRVLRGYWCRMGVKLMLD